MTRMTLTVALSRCRLSSSGAGSASLQELTLLAAARRSAAAAAAAAAAAGGMTSSGPHSMGMAPSGGGELHPAYRLNPYVEHLYSSLHSSPTASLRGLSPLDPRGKALRSLCAQGRRPMKALRD